MPKADSTVVLIVAAEEQYEQQLKDLNRGGSSDEYLVKLCSELLRLLERHRIQSMFDAGCNDCKIGIAVSPPIKYYGGDISMAMVADSWLKRPDLDIKLHDITTDPLPLVDLLFVKDVTIHLNDEDKKKIISNWLSSNIPYIMITHDEYEKDNIDFNYADGFPFAFVNWEQSPWNFPKPLDVIYEVNHGGRCMALWHRDQICQLFA